MLADSTAHWAGYKGQDELNTGDLLQELNPDMPVSTISHAAYHVGVYEAFSKYICTAENKPKAVIFPINLRSFGSEWDPIPHWQFNEEIAQINREIGNQNRSSNPTMNFWYRFYYLFTEKELTESEVIEGSFVNYPTEEILTLRDSFGEETLDDKKARIFVNNYLYDLNPNHRKVTQLGNTLKSLHISFFG